MKFCDRLFELVKPVWDKTHRHPFVQGLGDGTLPEKSFIFYMKQDYVFLIDYARLFALASAKAGNLEHMASFARLLDETLHGEMDLHRQYAEQFGITRGELEQTRPTPVNLAYTRYMLQTAHSGSLAELVSSLLPCMWSYWEIGRELAEKHPQSTEHPLYGNWVRMYSSEEFGDLAKWLIGVLNELADGKPERELAVLEEHFLTTSRFEYLFWDMVYRGEDWPAELTAK